MPNGLRSLAKAMSAAITFFFLLVFLEGYPLLEENERTVIDDLGQQVKLKADMKKIVSLVPTNSELVCLLDCTRLKGGTRYDRFPEELVKRVKDKEIEIIGGGFDPNLEKIVEIGPDLVLTDGPSQQRFVLPLKRMGYSVFSLYPQDIEGIQRDFLLLGEILDEEVKARKIVEGVEKGLKKFTKKMRQKRAKRVYLQTWPDPMITVGQASFSQRLLSLAGGINVFEDMRFDSGKVSVESLIQRNPEVLIFVDKQEGFVKKILKLPEWKHIDGVKNHRICFIDAAYLRRTIQFLDGVEKIYRCLFESAPG
jgi:iron complex transport system substrate-binding protein